MLNHELVRGAGNRVILPLEGGDELEHRGLLVWSQRANPVQEVFSCHDYFFRSASRFFTYSSYSFFISGDNGPPYKSLDLYLPVRNFSFVHSS